MKTIMTILAFGLYLGTATAQDLLDELPVREVRQYTVEVIIFTYEENVSVGSEIFVADKPPQSDASMFDEDGNPINPEFVFADDAVVQDKDSESRGVWTINRGARPQSYDGDGSDLRLVLLREDEFVLGKELRKFELLDAYKTIMHFGWTQPTYIEADTPAIDLDLFGRLPAGLDGTLTLYLNRYLHLVVDLALDAPNQPASQAQDERRSFGFGDSRTSIDDRYGNTPQQVHYRIQEDRILKNGELRYFDHPKFGVLAKVTRVEEEEQPEAVQIPLIGSGG